MNVVFIGASIFGLKCFESLLDLSSVTVKGVISNEQAFDISYSQDKVSNVLYADIPEIAKKNNVPFYVMQKSMKEPGIFHSLESWKADLIVVVGWYHMIPKTITDKTLTIGMHASLLPDYSGGAPLVWAIIHGEKKTGITLFKLGDGVDNGPILGQSSTVISDSDTICSLYERVELLGINLLRNLVPKIEDGSAIFHPQDDSKRRMFSQRSPKDGEINWNWPARKVYDFIRAQTHPYPGAFSTYKKQLIHIWGSTVMGNEVLAELPSGTIVGDKGNKVLVSCGENTCLQIRGISLNGIDLNVCEMKEFFDREPGGNFV